jgi:hypothetical protein
VPVTRRRISSIFWKSSACIAAKSGPPPGPLRATAATRRPIRVASSSIRSTSTGNPDIISTKWSMRLRCQPDASCRYQSGSVGRLLRALTTAGVRWKTYTCCALAARGDRIWMLLAPVPITATRLSASLSRLPFQSPPVTR